MALVSRFHPPGDLAEFQAIPEQCDRWHLYIRGAIRSAIDTLSTGLRAEGSQAPGTPQFYDPSRDDFGPTIGQDILWNAFPGELLRRFGRQEALRLADTLWPLPAYQLGFRYDPNDGELPDDNTLRQLLDGEVPFAREHLYRPQVEYCEWRTDRDSAGRVQRVTFTCEPPEYWRALFGGRLHASGVDFPGDPDAVLKLYQKLVSPSIVAGDLLAQRTTDGHVGSAKGDYNPYNRWNTTCGIAHLAAPPNALAPEILLAARSARLYKNARDETVVLPEILSAGAQLGNCNRNSDVAIVAAINALARQGRRITLCDPVGICMDHIDLAGWEFPPGLTSDDFICRVRGEECAALRLVIESRNPLFDVSDVRIGGVPIFFGGQIAECITVKLRAVATVAGGIRNERDVLTIRSFAAVPGGRELFAGPVDRAPQGSVPAFEHARSRPTAAAGAAPRADPTRRALEEPVLELDQIQGIAIPGFLKPSQTLLCVRAGPGESDPGQVKALLSGLLPHITTGRVGLADRDRYRRGAAAGHPLVAIAFSWEGIRKLTASAEEMTSAAFRVGLAGRSALLGNPTGSGEPGHPSTWVVGGPGNTPDFMIVVAGDRRTHVNAKVREISEMIRAAGCRVKRQDGNKLDRFGKSREHFGFVDGISQPGVRGRSPEAADSFVTPSFLADWPASSLQGHPGQDLVWPGEFVLGYARSGPDPLLPGPVARPELPWMRNGSYLVYNRLLQDVGAFWKMMREEAERLSGKDGFAELSAEGLASRLVGRTRDGVPVSRLQGPERCFHEGMGSNPFANNHFRFDSDTPRVPLSRGSDAYPSAKADPLGLVCPVAAHIRKVNPRDGASDVGGASASQQHRILRVGISFGPKRRNLKDDPSVGEAERGQLFLCIQSSIEDQFEFLQSRWMNDGSRPRSPGGHDMIAGRTPGGERTCPIFGSEGQKQDVRMSTRFVTLSGGGYFFVPSISAIRDVFAA